MRLIDADKAKEQIKQMQTLKPSERMLFRLALDRTPTYEPPNLPLTLDELREMDDPVWIEWCDSKSQDENEWALVNQGACRTFNGFAALFEWYGYAWLAYRRKPEDAQ